MTDPLLTTSDAALTLGITERRVRALASARRIGRRIGRQWVFAAADVEAMRIRTPGNPHVTKAPGPPRG